MKKIVKGALSLLFVVAMLLPAFAVIGQSETPATQHGTYVFGAEPHEDETIITSLTEWKYLDDNSDPWEKSPLYAVLSAYGPSATDMFREYWAANKDITFMGLFPAGFDDSYWKTGTGPFGYADGDGPGDWEDLGTTLNGNIGETDDRVETYFFRYNFELDDASWVKSIYYNFQYNDAAIIYLNGKEIGRYNVPEVGYSHNVEYGCAVSLTDGYMEAEAAIMIPGGLLLDGWNTIAVELHQEADDGPDVYFNFTEFTISEEYPPLNGDPDITALTMQPGSDETERNFSWLSNITAGGSLSIWEEGSETGVRDFPAEGELLSLHWGYLTYKVTVTGIEPGKTYEYKVSNEDVENEYSAESEVYSFTAAASDAAFSFVVYGDVQIGSGKGIASDSLGWQTTLTNTFTEWPELALIISAGDQINTADPAEFDGFFAPEELRSVRLAPTMGNHDNDPYFAGYYNVPNESDKGVSAAGGDYWYSIGEVLFMHLNSNSMNTEEHEQFMIDAIAEYKEANGGKDPAWKIVTFHHALYSDSMHSAEDDIYQRRIELSPVMAELGVDVVFAGHDHVYTRSYMLAMPFVTETRVEGNKGIGLTPIMNGYKADGNDLYAEYTKYNSADVLYIEVKSGSGGDIRDIIPIAYDYVATSDDVKRQTVTKVDITAGSLVLSTYYADEPISENNLIDRFTLNRGPEPEMSGLHMQPGSDETEMNFTWFSNVDVAGTITIWTEGGEANAVQFGADEPVAMTQLIGFCYNKVTVSGLQPNTTYYYKVMNGTSDFGVYSFTTGDPDDFSFLLVGDVQIGADGGKTQGKIDTDTAAWIDTLNNALNAWGEAAFIVSAGDQTETSSGGYEPEYTGFFLPEWMTQYPLSPTVGNHDNNALYNEHWNQPNQSQAGGNNNVFGDYWYAYGDVLFMHINSITTGAANNWDIEAHKQFMIDAIDAYKEANDGKEPAWKIMVFHHGLYTSASHTTDSDIYVRREFWSPVIAELDIDVVLNGHDHVYTRSYMLSMPMVTETNVADNLGAGLTPIMTGYTEVNGDPYGSYTKHNAGEVLFIEVNSASGAKYYAEKATAYDFWAASDQAERTTITKIDVTATSLTFSTYYADEPVTEDNLIDRFTLNRGESIVGVHMQPGPDESEMYFTWFSTSADPGTLTITSSEVADLHPDAISYLEPVAMSKLDGYYAHRAIVTGLFPSTTYDYTIGGFESTFRTADPGDFSFLLVGDVQIGSDGATGQEKIDKDTAEWINTLNAAFAEWPELAFIVSAGDQTETSSGGYEPEYTGFFSPEWLSQYPLAQVVGNHDNNALYEEHYTQPNQSMLGKSNALGDYWFAYGEILFLCINSTSGSNADGWNISEHEEFMRGAIAAYKAANNGKEPAWKIMVFHHGIFTNADHPNDADIHVRREMWAPVIGELDIDVVLNGHDHVYTRSYMMDGINLTQYDGEVWTRTGKTGDVSYMAPTPIKDGYTADGNNLYASYAKKFGETLYIEVNTASGAKFYDVDAYAPPMYDYVAAYGTTYDSKVQPPVSGTPMVTKIDVTNGSLVISTYYTDDLKNPIDTFTLGRAEEQTVNAAQPTINGQPSGGSVVKNGSKVLSVSASVSDGGSLSYQWYKDGAPISGATNTTYAVNTSAAGTSSYYVIVKNTNNGVNGNTTATTQSSTVSVTVTAPSEQTDDDGGNDNTMIIVAVAIIAVIVLVLLAYFVFLRP